MLPPLRHIAPQFSDGSRMALNFLIAHGGLSVCSVFLLVGLVAAGDYGIDPDERAQRQIARANWEYILGRADYDDFLVKAEVNERQLIPANRYYGVAFELPLLLAERALGLEDYHNVHRLRLAVTHLFFILGGFFCYRLACNLFGNRLIALFALLIFLLHPRIYAHSYINSKDLPFLSMFIIALYLLERAFRKDTVGAFVLLGMGIGLLTNLRIMGVTLFAATLVLRGLDLFYAGGGPERKRALLTGGLFLLAAGLTVYALSPYAWSNPVDYLAASLELTVNHPVVLYQRFQGEWLPSDQLPPHYNFAYFSITMPPPFLLLGGLGAAVAAAAGLRRPGRIFRNNRRRFSLLLLACFLLPPLAAALLGANQYQDWRHFYFLYAPFCLLAAGGLGWLAAVVGRRRRGPAGAYGLTGLGVGLVILQLAQLHPLQYSYFNFLVDRTTPEYLRTRYTLDYGLLATRAALEYLLASNPGEISAVRGPRQQAITLPAAARRRLRFNAANRSADYELLLPHQLEPSRPDWAFNAAYRRRLYNNTLSVLRPLDSSRMTAAAGAAYGELYRQAVAGEPIIRADYNVYRHGQRLTFVQENCPPAGGDVRFYVKSYPRPQHISETAPPTIFHNDRVRLGDICLAVIQLPDYVRGDLAISRNNLDKFLTTSPVWEEFYGLSAPGLRERIVRWRQGSPAGKAAAFDLFLDRDAAGRYRLLYAKRDCAPADYDIPAFLHIYPENRADLPFYLWQSGVDNREFRWLYYGIRSGGECLAVYPLPEYPIAAVLTGQAGVWEKSIYPPADPERLRAAYAALSASQPAARADFDLYVQDDQLVYLRESCAAADTAAGFFLHIIPEDVADLPAERQAAGFANRDFAFARWGGAFDGKCLAAIPLPEYPIKTIRTGQFVPGQGELWAAEVAVRW